MFVDWDVSVLEATAAEVEAEGLVGRGPDAYAELVVSTEGAVEAEGGEAADVITEIWH